MSPVNGARDVTVELESRIAMMEQRSATVAAPSVAVTVDPTTGAAQVSDSLAWVSGWESYTQLTGFIPDVNDPGYPGGTPSTDYGIAQAYRLANTCFLTGLVRRRTSSLNVNPRWDLPMFSLPVGWRPIANVPLLCAMGSSAPDGTLNVVNMAWIEVRPEPAQDAGRVFFITASAAMTVNTSWVALQGSFPMVITETAV